MADRELRQEEWITVPGPYSRLKVIDGSGKVIYDGPPTLMGWPVELVAPEDWPGGPQVDRPLTFTPFDDDGG